MHSARPLQFLLPDTMRVQRLMRLHPKLIDLGLERIERLLATVGSPQKKLPPVVHVAGTNGKGSLVATLRAMAEDLEGLDHGAGVDAAIDRIAATTACHAAVKANYPLTAAKMAHILEALRQTAFSTICPHGRPVMLRVTRREVERSFQRT